MYQSQRAPYNPFLMPTCPMYQPSFGYNAPRATPPRAFAPQAFFAGSEANFNNQWWYPDSSASHHVTPDASNLSDTISLLGSVQASSEVLLRGLVGDDGLYKFPNPATQVSKSTPSLNTCLTQSSSMNNYSTTCASPCTPLAHSDDTSSCKSHRLPTSLSTTMYSQPFELVVCDLWGPAPMKSSCGYTYFLTCADAFSSSLPSSVPSGLSTTHNTPSLSSHSSPALITSDLVEANTISPSSPKNLSPGSSPDSPITNEPFINPLNVHPMQTRAKRGITLPRLNPTPNLTHMGPTSVG
ncbi:hypothetical protein KIW84_031628 [Lathyrus oleraceus]|uniref:Uncharacterized protein n=1 Tax=Pisum sativum TaxID=3888 RepID=A0A9D4XVE0_PEA|nr:hypothetical protein KIW84_031628 [Pisum sativum]